jgi:hypothetical protein
VIFRLAFFTIVLIGHIVFRNTIQTYAGTVLPYVAVITLHHHSIVVYDKRERTLLALWDRMRWTSGKTAYGFCGKCIELLNFRQSYRHRRTPKAIFEVFVDFFRLSLALVYLQLRATPKHSEWIISSEEYREQSIDAHSHDKQEGISRGKKNREEASRKEMRV